MVIMAFALPVLGCDPGAPPEGEELGEAEGEMLAAVDLTGCPDFAASYATCEKLDGSLPEFFQDVQIETHAGGYSFTTQTEYGPQYTEYVPDRVVRLGSDYHTLDDGTVLPDLPSLESSYCEASQMFRREFTMLPDRSLAEETITMHVGMDGELLFEIDVDGQRLLEARCFE